MAAEKISQLPSASALTGSEVLPVVQSGSTVQASVAQVRAGLAAATHSHAVADTTGLQAALDAKAALAHGHAVADTTGLQAALDAKAALTHSHAIADTANLQATLDAKLAQGKRTTWVPAAAMSPRTDTSGGGPASGSTLGTNKVLRKTLDFDAATVEYAQFTIAMPKSWNEGTVSAQVIWTAASGSGSTVWGLQGVAISDDDALDPAFGAGVTVTDTLLAAADCHISAETAAVTLGGAPAELDLVVFQVYRDATSGGDTLGVDAQLIGVRLFYTVNAGNDA